MREQERRLGEIIGEERLADFRQFVRANLDTCSAKARTLQDLYLRTRTTDEVLAHEMRVDSHFLVSLSALMSKKDYLVYLDGTEAFYTNMILDLMSITSVRSAVALQASRPPAIVPESWCGQS